MLESSSVDTSSVIGLIRHLLSSVSTGTEGGATAEEIGCILWDLSAGENISKSMVIDGRMLDVVEAIFHAQLSLDTHDSRILEICMGIMGNLATSEELAGSIAGAQTLLDTITGHMMFLDDTPVLSELCRLASVALRKQVRTSTLPLYALMVSPFQPPVPGACMQSRS